MSAELAEWIRWAIPLLLTAVILPLIKIVAGKANRAEVDGKLALLKESINEFILRQREDKKSLQDQASTNKANIQAIVTQNTQLIERLQGLVERADDRAHNLAESISDIKLDLRQMSLSLAQTIKELASLSHREK